MFRHNLYTNKQASQLFILATVIVTLWRKYGRHSSFQITRLTFDDITIIILYRYHVCTIIFNILRQHLNVLNVEQVKAKTDLNL